MFFLPVHAQTIKILFDATKAEAASNADWVIDADANNLGFSASGATLNGGNEANAQRIPSPAQSGITVSTSETFWKGALSNWGIDCVNKNYTVETLPYNGQITYGNSSNVQDLSNYNVFIVCEPNMLFTLSEKIALLNFVQNGGGLFMISDHDVSDRNNDGQDSPHIWNDFMTNNSIKSNPFGITFDYANFSETTTNIPSLPLDSLLNGMAGNVTQVKFSNGTSMTLSATANSSVKGIIYKTGSAFGTSNVMCAYARYGKGKVVAFGDSSPCDDGTGDPNDNLFNGYTGDVAGNHRKLLMNATIWLASSSPVTADFTASTLTPCLGLPVTFTNASTSAATSYSWNFGAGATPATANSVGPHTVTYSSSGFKTVALTVTNGGVNNTTTKTNFINVGSGFQMSTTVFSENMGTVTATTAIATHETNNGFQNVACTMSGTADVRNTQTSSGYTGVSGGANVFFNTTVGKNLIISGISTSAYSSLQLSFGIFKSLAGATGSDFKVQYSTDGTTWVNLTMPALPAGAAWFATTVTGSIPSVPNLRLQFIQNGTASQYRVDDLVLIGNIFSPTITASGPVVFCQGGSTTLVASVANNYLWSTGATTPSITVATSGNYQVAVTDANGCVANSNQIAVTVNPLLTWYRDLDADGYGNPSVTNVACAQPLGYVFNNSDCNDNSNSINPYATEVCGNGIDDNCNAMVDEECTTILNLKLFIEGYYDRTSKAMIPALFNRGVSTSATDCDSITVELRNATSPFAVFTSTSAVIHTNGTTSLQFPSAVLNNSYYVVVKSLNTLETWSKLPVTFNTNPTLFDFTAP